LSCPVADIAGLTQQAAEQAAGLLRLPRLETQVSDAEEVKNLPPDVLQAYSEAEQLAKSPDHSGLKQSILRYQDALELDPHFAVGYAKLAVVYVEQYLITREPANIDLAEKNASKALQYNPNSAMGLISEALCFLYSGKTSDAFAYFAKALKVDPGNPMVLTAKAEAMLNAGRLPDAEQVYHDIVAERPNYWQAYNNLGVALSRQARYEEAEKAFAEASMTAPTVALPMANLGVTYIQLGKPLEARNKLTESLKRGASKDTYLALGDLDFESKNYDSALNYYQKASDIEPNFHLIQRNIGDCYAMLGNHKLETESYRKAANLISNSLSVNPQNGYDWANLAFYHAKIGNATGVKADIRNAEMQGGQDVASRFMIAQALAVQGKKEDSLKLLLWCVDNGLSPQDVDLAIDLRDIQRDPRYQARLKSLSDRKASSG
ncbi:MAG: tetratricopeptide repeat protein, partial [Terracidiphilus sp.]